MTRADQRRRGQPRPAAEGRRAGEVADVGVGQLRSDHRAAESRREYRRQAADRERELYDRFNSLAARLDKLIGEPGARARARAGQLLHDKQLYENMNAAASELRLLIGDIRKDPKKYLNVRVSIF